LTGGPGARRRPFRGPTPLLCLLLLLAACGGDGRGGPPREGDAAPGYAATTLDGEEVSLQDLEGSPVLLNFWATWCTPCRREMPFLQELYQEHRDDGLRVVGVSMDSRASAEEVRTFAERTGVTYTILHDASARGMDVFSVLGLPATYLLDRNGTIRFVRVGPILETDREFLDALEEIV